MHLHTKKFLVMLSMQWHFDYACSFWYPGLNEFLRNRLQPSQNQTIRFVLRMGPRSQIGQDVFKAVGWLPVSKRVNQIILYHAFKLKSGPSSENMT